MRLRLLLATLLLAAIAAILVLNTPRYRATVTNMTGYCLDVEPQREWLAGAERQLYRKTPRRNLYLHIFHPPSGSRSGTAVMLLFGGGWREGDIASLKPIAAKLAEDGHVVILPDYRVRCRDRSRIGDSVADSMAAYAWVRRHAGALGVDPAQVILGGESAGGHLALVTALESGEDAPPAALLLFNPVVDLPAMSTQLWLDHATARSLSPHLMPLRTLPPTLVFHGTADTRVPIETARRFCAAATFAGRTCRLTEFDGLDHGFLHLRQPNARGKSSPFDTVVAQARRFLADLPSPTNQ